MLGIQTYDQLHKIVINDKYYFFQLYIPHQINSSLNQDIMCFWKTISHNLCTTMISYKLFFEITYPITTLDRTLCY